MLRYKTNKEKQNMAVGRLMPHPPPPPLTH